MKTGQQTKQEAFLYKMKIGDISEVTYSIHGTSVSIHRVPGGWNFVYENFENITAVFVPFISICN